MFLERGRFIAVGVFAAALLVGLGELLTEAPREASRSPQSTGAPQRSGDDGGFSIVLARPRDPYLVGRQKITIDPTVPAGDAIAQVDFFIDGRLVHTIVVTALTGGGRRAKVSFVSRSTDLSDSASRPIVIIPAVVRDATGRIFD